MWENLKFGCCKRGKKLIKLFFVNLAFILGGIVSLSILKFFENEYVKNLKNNPDDF